jgi:hypothetical protein
MPWLLLNGVGVDDEGIVAAAACPDLSRPFRILAATEETTTVDRGRRMSGWSKARIQLCGRFVADIDGCRVEDTLPGRRGRLVFAYLVLNRGRALPRDELLVVGWGEDARAEAGNALSVLLSKLRHSLGSDHLRGRTEIELLLPQATFVDVEAALEGAHRAESAIAEGRWEELGIAPNPDLQAVHRRLLRRADG